jgi:hypothetical protein
MDFLKKHYERILLGAVLLGLAGAVAFLPFKIAADKQELEAKKISLLKPNVKPLTNLDLTPPETVLKRMAAPVVVNFAPPNKLFNPMPWQKTADGRLVPFDDRNIGPKAVTITKLSPLYLEITLDSVSTNLGSSAIYMMGIKKEASSVSKERSKRQTACSANSQNETFAIRDVQGPATDPTNIVIELKDTFERGSLTPAVSTNAADSQRPLLMYRRVDGYTADLSYKGPPESKTWTQKRINMPLIFNNEEYIIVAINSNEVVLSAKSNQKKWTVKYNP